MQKVWSFELKGLWGFGLKGLEIQGLGRWVLEVQRM